MSGFCAELPMEVVCKKCKRVQPATAFRKYIDGQGTQRIKRECKTCLNIRAMEWRNKNKERANTTQKNRLKGNKRRAVDMFGNKCAICQQTYPIEAYDFHHLSDKDKNMAIMFNYSWEATLTELIKCALFCANCHRIHHASGENMSKFTTELHMDLVKAIVLRHFNFQEEVDKPIHIWYNSENNTINIGLQDDQARDEAN